MYYLSKPLKEKLKRKLAKYLSSGEEIVLATGVGRRYAQTQVVGSLLLLPVLIGLVGLSKVIYLIHALTYILTTRRVLIKRGIYSIKLTSIPYDKITHITVAQNFLEQYALNSGRIVIYTAGYDQREIVLEHVEAPLEFKNILEDLMIKERQLVSGVHSSEESSEPQEIMVGESDQLHPIELG